MASQRQSAMLQPHEQDALLKALGEARRALVNVQASMARGSIMRSEADTLIGNVDEMAQLLTGRRDYFHVKAHGLPRANEMAWLSNTD